MNRQYWSIAGLLMLSACENPQHTTNNIAVNATADYGTLAETNATDPYVEHNLTTVSDNAATNANGGPYTQSEPDSDKTVRNKSK